MTGATELTEAAQPDSPGIVRSSDGLGVAVLVDGVLVAWFADMDDETEDFCRDMWFGRWLTWRARQPQLVPLTPEEQSEVDERVRELTAQLRVE